MAKPKTIDIELSAPHEGWKATMRASGISARIYIELASGDVERQMEALKKLTISHNFKDGDGNPVEDILDAELDVLGLLVTKWSDGIAALPNG